MRTLGLVAAPAFLLALACASDPPAPKLTAGSATPEGSGPPPPTAPVPAPTAARAPGFAGVKARGALLVAADPEAPPFLSRTGTGYEGLEYAVAQAIADRAGVPLTVVAGKFEELPGLVTSGKADLVIGQLAPSSAYEGLAFSASYLQYSLCLVVPKGSPVKSMPDLGGKRVGMYDDPVARQLADVLIGASYDRQLYSDYGYWEKMTRGQLDAMVYDCPLVRYELKPWKDQLVVVDDALNVTTYNVGLPAGDKTLLGEVDAVLRELGDSGLLATLQERWLGGVGITRDMETDAGKVVVVKKGDTLSVLAARHLKSKDRYKEIYERNKDVIGPDPNLIYQGMVLRLPK